MSPVPRTGYVSGPLPVVGGKTWSIRVAHRTGAGSNVTLLRVYMVRDMTGHWRLGRRFLFDLVTGRSLPSILVTVSRPLKVQHPVKVHLSRCDRSVVGYSRPQNSLPLTLFLCSDHPTSLPTSSGYGTPTGYDRN